MKNSNKLFNIFLCFIFYSFLGWVIETIYMSIYYGHLVKRGFLISPLCGVYGIGLLLVVFIVRYIKASPLLLCLYSALATTMLELVTGFLLYELFDLRLWNYSERFANFMGFICLRNSVWWGILAVIIVNVIHPAVSKVVFSIPVRLKELLCYSFMVCLMFDLTVSVYTALHGINNFAWVSQILFERIKYLENVTDRVVYLINR